MFLYPAFGRIVSGDLKNNGGGVMYCTACREFHFVEPGDGKICHVCGNVLVVAWKEAVDEEIGDVESMMDKIVYAEVTTASAKRTKEKMLEDLGFRLGALRNLLYAAVERSEVADLLSINPNYKG